MEAVDRRNEPEQVQWLVTPDPRPRVLIVDDEIVNIEVLRVMLERYENYRVFHASSGFDAMPLARRLWPDIVLLDVMMPQKTGFMMIEEIRRDATKLARVPIIVMTAANEEEIRLRALNLGANDFVGKPFHIAELRARIRNNLRVKQYEDELERQNQRLEERVFERTAELSLSRIEIIRRLGKAAEFRDDETGHHVARVGASCAIMGGRLGLPPERIELLFHASPMHDIGKIAIPDSILLKKGRLTAEEFEVMKRHTVYGAALFNPLDHLNWDFLRHQPTLAGPLDGHDQPILGLAKSIALSHHERWDGKGYPHGLVGDEIPIEGRIAAVADVFDALMSDRPYKKAFSLERSLEIVKEGGGTQFDPEVVEAFFASLEDISRARRFFADQTPPAAPDES